MRDLASVVTVATTNKMFEKDRICWATLEENGYEVIIPSTIQPGDRMVFIQEGSILPEIERWEFLRKRCYNKLAKGFVIKPMTMGAKDFNGEKGDRVKSWGLCVTLSEAGLDKNLKSGTNVTNLLNIRKYEPEEDVSLETVNHPSFVKFCMKYKSLRWLGKLLLKRIKANRGVSDFPSEIISKSDETTIQNCKSILDQFDKKKAFITAKMEGQSFTCSLDKNKKKMYVCSRNNRYNPKKAIDSPFVITAKKYNIEKKLKNYLNSTGKILILQGEQVGPTIQGNIYDLKEIKWFVFRVKEILPNGQIVELNYESFKDIVKDLGLDVVPLIDVVDDMGAKFKDIESLISYAEKTYWKPINEIEFDFNYKPKDDEKIWKNYLQHEGIVIKSEDYNKERNIGFSFKVKNMSYQEKHYADMNKICKNLK